MHRTDFLSVLSTRLLITLLTDTMKQTLIATLFITLLLYSGLSQAQQRFSLTTLNIGVHLIQAEVALSESERAQGLMFRDQLGQNEGMVFRFTNTNQVCMWMKNTLLPLSVAFMDEEGKIINIEDMQQQTLDAHCAKKPARYALEMNLGWFRKKNIRQGNVISGLPK